MHLLLAAAAILLGVGALAARYGKKYARRVQREQRIRVDRFKLKRRHAAIASEVMASAEVTSAIEEFMAERGVGRDEATRQARQYLAEIVPKFNLLAYYRIGAPIARVIMHFLYRVVVERKTVREFTERERGAVFVFVINHRSNADYVLVAHMLFKFISLSYAIGEWARVWPLNHLFKWFGGYFVRRRFREPLYHAVLASFVRTITRNGVTQGVFIEGGLSRDGAFQKPKLGMLDYIVTAKQDPAFTAPLYLIPTAVNYDRVLEDRTLMNELLGREERASAGHGLRTAAEYLFKNFFRGLFGRFKRYGYAIVSFGKPIAIDDFVRDHPAVLAASFEDRKPELQRLAALVMSEIARALPVTPVTIVASIFARQPVLTEKAMLSEIARFRSEYASRTWLLREKTPAEIWRAARQVLTLRHLVVPAEQWRTDLFEGGGAPELDDAWQWSPADLPLRDYYARSLDPAKL